MRIGFDVSPLVRPHPPGVVRAVRGAVEALEQRGRIEVVRLAPEPGDDLRRWRHQGLPGLVAEQSLVGIHSFVSAYPRRGPGRRVQTVHELPWHHGVAENAGWRHRYWASLGSRRADAIVVPSEATARDLRRSPFVRKERVHVVPWGVGPPFEVEPPPGEVDEVVLTKYRLPEERLVLCLGAVRKKKNLAGVIEGLARLAETGFTSFHLVVTGADTPDLRRDLGLVSRRGLSRRVSTPGVIADLDLPALLRVAAAVVVLSRSEGFGFPALEALACGTPVVVARGGAPAEIVGDAGAHVDADDPDEVAAAIRDAVTRREELRWTLPTRAREFTWERCAEGLERVWLAPDRASPE